MLIRSLTCLLGMLRACWEHTYIPKEFYELINIIELRGVNHNIFQIILMNESMHAVKLYEAAVSYMLVKSSSSSFPSSSSYTPTSS